MPLRVLSNAQVARWSDARLKEEWDEMLWRKASLGWKGWRDVPQFYRHNAQVMEAEIRRRGEQLRFPL